MVNLSDIRMKPKLIGLFLVAGLIPLIIVGLWSSKLATEALMHQSFNQLNSVRGIKKAQIEKYFDERQADMGVLMETVGTLRLEALNKLSAVQNIKKDQINNFMTKARNDAKIFASMPFIEKAVKELDTLSKEAIQNGYTGQRLLDYKPYKTAFDQYYTFIKQYKEEYNYYDVFLFSPNSGRILLTVDLEDDFGTEMKSANTHLAIMWQKMKGDKKVHLTDIAPYAPSNNAPAMFVMAPALIDGKYVGGIGMQISLKAINKIMLNRVGMGETGESYLVGQDKLMRSDSFMDMLGHSVAAAFKNNTQVDTEAIRNALAGNSNQDVVKDYNGTPVISCWDAIQIDDGIHWAMLSDIDVAEAFSPVDVNGKEFYKKYIEKYGYYDLFLINPDGYVFYSVTRESDYQTNMVNGKYANSNLGKLVRQVLKSHKYGMVDFKPYAPSNGAPAAFIAEPVIHEGDIEIVVAMQLPLTGINNIMQLREGMGKTGESYLIGSDKRMRSDSFLDKNGHSVAASFAGTIAKNGVDTEAANQALAGKSDDKVIIDYNGNQVLSSYTPLKVAGVTWAVLAEIDKAEVMAPIKSIIMSITIVALIIAVLVAILAMFVARQIALPLAKGVDFAKTISEKDLSQNLDINQGDEIGDLARALNHMTNNLSGMIQEIDSGVETLSSSSTEMSTIANQMASGSETTVEKSNTVAAAAEEMNSNMTSVAAAMEQASTNVSTVASGAEQMSASIGEIATNAAKASDSTRNAVERALKASTQVNELGKAAEEIEVVTETIKAISDKTNLLALNATIEAARAGEAGKGFAVVANEIKDLAQQTAGATGDIAAKLQGIQQSTSTTVHEIEEVSTAIALVDEVVNAIAAAVEQQNAATKDISENIGQVSMGLQEVNENVTQSSQASGQVAQEITEVNEAANEMSNSSAQVQQSAGDLSKLSEQLKELVGQFRL